MANELAVWASVTVAIISLVVAIIALCKSDATQHRIIKIEERRDNERRNQSMQAKLRSHIRKNGNGYRLYLFNLGAGEARNIRMGMDGTPLSEHCSAVLGSPMPDRLGPESEISCILGLHLQCQPPFNLKVMWDDDFSQNHVYETSLTL